MKKDLSACRCVFSIVKHMQSLTSEESSYCERVRLLAPLPLCLSPCLFSPGVMQTPFHRQNILCRSCQSVYPQAWVSIWGLTSNIENWPAAPTAFPAKHPRREWERGREGRRGREDVKWGGGRHEQLVGQKGRERETEQEERRLEDRK